MNNKFKWKLLYKPPMEHFDENEEETWTKMFYISTDECKDGLSLTLKIHDLIRIYNMDREYITLEDMETGKICKGYYL